MRMDSASQAWMLPGRMRLSCGRGLARRSSVPSGRQAFHHTTELTVHTNFFAFSSFCDLLHAFCLSSCSCMQCQKHTCACRAD